MSHAARQQRMRDSLLVTLTFSSGAVDAISFLALGKVFSAFMTGNIAFLGIRLAGAPAPGAWAILIAIVAFALGVYVSVRVAQAPHESGVWPQRVTVALSLSLVPHAIFQGVWLATTGQPSGDVSHVLLGLWGLAMGMQSAAVRTLGVEGVFTTAATATVIVLTSDVPNQSATFAEKWRLASVLVALLAGATAGALLLVHARVYAPFLPFAATASVVVIATIVFAKHAVR